MHDVYITILHIILFVSFFFTYLRPLKKFSRIRTMDEEFSNKLPVTYLYGWRTHIGYEFKTSLVEKMDHTQLYLGIIYLYNI